MEQTVYARKASGLVREVSVFDAFIWNLWCTCPINLPVFTFAIYATLLQGADLNLGFLIYVIAAMLLGSVYAHFVSAMPRSGGEYVFLGRTMHPLLGFVINWGVVSTFFFWFALNALYTASTFTALLSLFVPAESVAFLGQPIWTYIIIFVIQGVAALLVIPGMRWYVRWQSLLAVIGFVGIGAVVATFLGVGGPSGFSSWFNGWASTYMPGSTDPYHDIIRTGATLGYDAQAATQFSSINTLGWGMAVAGTYIPCAAFSSYIAGEVKKAESGVRQHAAMLGASVTTTVISIIMVWAILDGMGGDFVRAIYYVASDPTKFTLPISMLIFPHSLLVYLNPTAGFLALLALFLTGLLVCMMDVVMISRCMLAWSFDRVIPTAFSHVSAKYRTPTASILTMFVIGNLITAGAIFVSGFYQYTGATWYWVLLNLFVVSIAGLIFPFVRRDMFEAMPLKQRVAKIPLLTLISLGSLVFLGLMIYVYWVSPSFAAVYGALTPFTLATTVAVYGSAILIFFGSRAYWRRKSVNIDLAFKEIPPA
jgi:amino acid transporter